MISRPATDKDSPSSEQSKAEAASPRENANVGAKAVAYSKDPKDIRGGQIDVQPLLPSVRTETGSELASKKKGGDVLAGSTGREDQDLTTSKVEAIDGDGEARQENAGLGGKSSLESAVRFYHKMDSRIYS